MTRLFSKRCQVFPHLEAVRVEDRMLVSRNIWMDESYKAGPYDAFVYAYGGVSHDPLSAALKERGVRVELVGDAFSPRSLQHAILEGHSFGREL